METLLTYTVPLRTGKACIMIEEFRKNFPVNSKKK
jgi:hypothetical protein